MPSHLGSIVTPIGQRDTFQEARRLTRKLMRALGADDESAIAVTVTNHQYRVLRAMLYDGTNYPTAARRLGMTERAVNRVALRAMHAAGADTVLELAVMVWSGRLRIVSGLGDDLIDDLREGPV